ncbi:MAG: DUF4363 family protein [Acutalibacteraceae bacterium]|nr:DUF4363 family protein [Acutalibacteraceae bacterium]
MNRIVTAILIFILVIALAICETVYITSTSKRVLAKLDTAIEHYNSGEIKKAENEIKSADKIWEDNTQLMNAFLIHDSTDEVSERISTASVTLKYQKERFPIECASAIDSLKVIIYSMMPQIDNIL